MNNNNNNNYINGPFNTIRLEGTVNSVKKVIYLFMDRHQNVDEQSDCDSFLSLDIKDYLVQNFKNIPKNRVIDFMFEIRPTELQDIKEIKYKERYIGEVSKMFSKIFLNKDKISNVRLHYIDPRDYIGNDQMNLFMKLTYELNVIWNNKYIEPDNFDYMHNIKQELLNYINDLEKILKTNKFNIKKTKEIVPKTFEEYKNMTPVDFKNNKIILVNKIKNVYNDNKIKKLINDMLKDYVFKFINLYKKESDNFFNLLEDYLNRLIDNDTLNLKSDFDIYPTYGMNKNDFYKFISNLRMSNDNLDDYFHIIIMLIMDLYFLRRFLDKKYITNAIVYVGADHAINYIFTLIKHFDFKITHYSYLSTSKEKAMKFVKKSKNPWDITKIFFPPEFKQCSNLSGFPPNFE